MNDRNIKKLLKLERRQIEKELIQDRKLRFFSSRRKLILIMAIVICFSGVAFAYHQMSVYEWFMLESLGYDQILEQNPKYELDISVEDQDITIAIDGLVADDLNTYLYYHVSSPSGEPLRIKYHDGLDVLNAKKLYGGLKDRLVEKGLPEDYVDENFDNFYGAGSSSLAPNETASNREVLRFKAFDLQKGTVEILITQLQDAEGEIINGEWLFEAPFVKEKSETIFLDSGSILQLPYRGMDFSVEFMKMEMGVTATRLYYQDDYDDRTVNVSYSNFTMNDQPLRTIFLGGSGEDEYSTVDFFPVKVDKIKDIECEIDTLFIMEYVLEQYFIDEFPVEIEYEGGKLRIEESFTDRYQYTITDLGYATRDFEYLEFETYFEGGRAIMSQFGWEGCLIMPDGTELPCESVIEAMLHPEALKRTKVYKLETHYSDEELRDLDYLDYDGEPAVEFRIRREHKTMPVKEPITILKRHFWE